MKHSFAPLKKTVGGIRMRHDDFLSELRQDNFELYVQNILPGPLVLPDLDNLTLQKWETADLSVEDRDTLLTSKSLRVAVKKGFLRLLSAEQYEIQTDLYEERTDEEYDSHLEEIEAANGLRLDAEVIDLSAPAKKSRTKTASRKPRKDNPRENLNNPEYYAKKYQEAVQKYGVESPEEFKEMVDNNEIAVGRSGRRVKAAEAFSPEEYARKFASGEIEDPTKPELRMEKQAADKATVMTRKGAGRVEMSHSNDEDYDDEEYDDDIDGEIEQIDLDD